MWEISSLQSALDDDGYLSLPCKRVVAHKHGQHCVEQFLSGNFPGSRARIAVDTSVLAIILQMMLNVVTLFLAPNIFVTISAPIYEDGEVGQGGSSGRDPRSLHGGALEALARLDGDDTSAAHDWDASYFESSRNVRDVIERIYVKERGASWAEQAKEAFSNRRNFYFGGIPKVKFWTHQLFYIAYMLLPFLFLTHDVRLTANRTST